MNTKDSERRNILLRKIYNCIIFAIVVFSCAYLWNTFFASSNVPVSTASIQNTSTVQKLKPKYKYTRIADIEVGERVVTSEIETGEQLCLTELQRQSNYDLISHIDLSNERRQRCSSANFGMLLCYPKNEIIDVPLVLSICDDIIINASCNNINCNPIIGTSYVPGNLDKTDITPLLWRQIDLEMNKVDGSVAEINIIRPIWWIEDVKATIGKEIDIAYDEIGIYGKANVLAIKPCFVSSLEDKHGEHIVTGKIKHKNVSTWHLVFDCNNTSKILGITADHPLFSYDRNAWIPAGKIVIEEKISTLDGIAILKKKALRSNKDTVINIEVHKSHMYYVSDGNISAHNTILLDCSKTPVYRGGTKMIPRPRDIEVVDGMVYPATGGLSVNTDPKKVVSFGKPIQVISIPDELVIRNIPEGSTHYQIEPQIEMTIERYKELLSHIVLAHP